MGRRVSSDERQRIHRKQREGLSVKEIAQLFKRSSQTISRALREVRALSAAGVARVSQPPVEQATGESESQVPLAVPLSLQPQHERLPTRASTNPRHVPESAFVDGAATLIVVPESLQRVPASESAAKRRRASVNAGGAQSKVGARDAVQSRSTQVEEVNASVPPRMREPPRATRSPPKNQTTLSPPLQRELRSRQRQVCQDTPATLAADSRDVSAPSLQQTLPEADQQTQPSPQRNNDSSKVLPAAAVQGPSAANVVASGPSLAPKSAPASSTGVAPVIRPVMRPPRVLPFVRSAPSIQKPTNSSARSKSNETGIQNLTALSEVATGIAAGIATGTVATATSISTSSTIGKKGTTSKQQPPSQPASTPGPGSGLMELLLGIDDMSPQTSQEDGKEICSLYCLEARFSYRQTLCTHSYCLAGLSSQNDSLSQANSSSNPSQCVASTTAAHKQVPISLVVQKKPALVNQSRPKPNQAQASDLGAVTAANPATSLLSSSRQLKDRGKVFSVGSHLLREDSATLRAEKEKKACELQRIVSSLQERVKNLQQEEIGDDGGKLCDLLSHFCDAVLDLGISSSIGNRKRKRDEDAENIELGKLLREKLVAEVSVLRAQAERERVQLARERLDAQVEAALSQKKLEAALVSKVTQASIFAKTGMH